jgi:hypothetical protein
MQKLRLKVLNLIVSRLVVYEPQLGEVGNQLITADSLAG